MSAANYDKIIALLQAAAIPYKIHEHEAIRTVEEVEERLPHLAPIMVKTIAFALKDGRIALVAIHGKDRIDYRKVAQAVGTNRRNVRSMSPEEVLAELGYEVGSVGPFALQENVFVLIDAHVAQMPTLNCGSGKTMATLELSFAGLQRVTNAQVLSLAKE
jgi:Cys-tRNA(Pro)/Cys-tRNA(Cys) deacylase